MDMYMERAMFRQQQSDRPARDREEHALYRPGNGQRGGAARCGGCVGHVAETSIYTAASLHPWLTAAVVGAMGLAVATILAAAARPTRPGVGRLAVSHAEV